MLAQSVVPSPERLCLWNIKWSLVIKSSLLYLLPDICVDIVCADIFGMASRDEPQLSHPLKVSAVIDKRYGEHTLG